MPIFDALRPEGPREEGFVHVGEVGAGHYAKMVHNGIEYALMQAFAEGYELLDARSDLIKDVTGTFKAWQRGTVVRSWLLELLVRALEQDPEFEDIEGYVDDSGEGRWTIEEAISRTPSRYRPSRVDLRAVRLAPGRRFTGHEGRRRPARTSSADTPSRKPTESRRSTESDAAMIVDRLNLTDFRNYASADVGFAEGANLSSAATARARRTSWNRSAISARSARTGCPAITP